MKATSDRAIAKRINAALKCFMENDYEEAVYNIAPALDVTAKRRYPNKGVGARIKAFVFDEQPLIYYLSTQGKYDIPAGVRIVIVEDDDVTKPIGGNGGELSDFIYHNVRCAQSHDAEIDDALIDFGRDFGIGRIIFDGGELAPGKFIVSKSTVLAIILAVICAPENKGVKLSGNLNMFGKVTLDLRRLVGNKAYLMVGLKQLFQSA